MLYTIVTAIGMLAVGLLVWRLLPEPERLGERRVGEGGRIRWAPDHLKKKILVVDVS